MKYSAVLFCCLFVNASWSQRTMTIEDAVAASLAGNYDISLARNDSTLAALDYSYARYAFYPRLNANAGYSINTNNSKVVLLDGTKRERTGIRSDNLNASLNLNWTLFDGMKMFITRRRLNELIGLGELQIKAQVVNTVADVMRVFYDIVRQQQQMSAIEEQMALSQERLKLAQYKMDVGTGTRSDVLQAQIDYNGQRSQHLTKQTAINKLKDQLKQLLALPLTDEFNVVDTIPLGTSVSLDSVQGAVTNSNPDLLLLQKNIQLAELGLLERKAERWPTVAFNSAYNFNRTENGAVINPASPLFSQNRGLNYGITAAIPIFNGYVTRRNIQAAQLDIDYLELQYRRNLAAINTTVATAYRDYELYRQTLRLEEDNLRLVREYLFIARERYRLGVTTFLEMRVAEQNLADALTRLIETRYNTKVAEIELMRLRGDLVK